MKISYNWLKQFLQINLEAKAIAETLTDLGLEVEGIDTYESIKGGLKGVLIGKVLTCEKHPNADKLKITTVDVGEKEPLHIVCGAANVDKGQTVAVATVGTTLYNVENQPFKLKKSKIRGALSQGMICAEDELGLGTTHDGILVLDNDLKVGTHASEVFKIEIDQVFEIGLTPNRADAMSHYGVARDLRAALIQQGLQLELISPSASNFHVNDRNLKIDIDIENTTLVPRYCGVTISDITIAPSPEWIQKRLKAIGINPKNNVIDITNYVMHELGQPLHAFDASKIKGNKIQVKQLPNNSKITTLDGVERKLHNDDLVVCDEQNTPLCIAGVLGGINSGVSENTTSIFLESAYFNPVSVRKTAKRHSIHSDSSFRFERGVDPNFIKYALKRAALLIQEIAGGNISFDIVEIYPNKIEGFEVFLSYQNAYKLIGQKISSETIKNILASLEIKIISDTEGGLGLIVPPFRVDVFREADMIEEILRVYGYNKVEISHKINASITPAKFNKVKVENSIANQLTALGFFEAMSNSLTKSEYTNLSENIENAQNITLLNPLSNDLNVLRQSLLFSGLEALAYNLNRQNNSLKFFEFGKTYHKKNTGNTEQKHLTLLLTGQKEKSNWKNSNSNIDFFYLKGVTSAILQKLGASTFISKPTENTLFSEGIAIYIGKEKIVDLGLVNKSILKHFDIKQPVLFADFDWEQLINIAKNNSIKVKELPKYPLVKRDLALLLDENVTYEELHQLAFQSEKRLLKEVGLFDVYKGNKLPKNKKSYALNFILQDPNKTLEDKQVDKIMQKLQKIFEKEVGAELR